MYEEKERERVVCYINKKCTIFCLEKNFIYLGAVLWYLVNDLSVCFCFSELIYHLKKKTQIEPFLGFRGQRGVVVLDFLKRASFKNLWYLKFLCYELGIMFFSLEMHFRTWYHSYLHHFSTHQPFRVVCMCIVCLSACVAGPTSS